MADRRSEDAIQVGGSIPSGTACLEAFKPFINEYGMIPFCRPAPGVTQNDTLFTAYAMCAIFDELGHIPFVWKKDLITAYDKYMKDDGSTIRFPTSIEVESHDNLTGWGMAAFLLSKPSYAQKILSYARSNAWIWPGPEPEIKRYLGRHRAVEAHLMLAAGEKPDYIVQFFWAIAVVQGMFSSDDDADAYSLVYLFVRLAHASPIAPLPMVLLGWVWKLVQKARKRTMSKNLSAHYAWGNAPHAIFIQG